MNKYTIKIGNKELQVLCGNIIYMKDGISYDIPPNDEWMKYMLSTDDKQPLPSIPKGTTKKPVELENSRI